MSNAASCFGPDYTGVTVEDRIIIKLDKDKVTLETKCDSLLILNDSLNIKLDVFFPENFDHIQSYFTNRCTYTRVDRNSFVVNIGRVKDVGAYVIIDEENHINQLFFYSDRNTFDGAWLFKYGHMEEYKKSIFDFRIMSDTLVLKLDAHKRTPLYHINDRSMSKLQGYSNSNLHGCALCFESDSTTSLILNEERIYYKI
ncbi:MAG: hypothetical protein AAFN65_09355, partial [Bacteroidota bacterium]